MDDQAVARAAALLTEARLSGNKIERLPEDCRPANAADSYRIQEAVQAKLGWAVGAWKAGLPPGGLSSSAPIFAKLIHQSPASLPVASVPQLGVEGEIAFRLGRDLPKRHTPYTEAEVMDAVAEMLAVIEVIDSRYAEPGKPGVHEHLADNFQNGGFVVGSGVTDWRGLPRDRLRVVLTAGEKTLCDRLGGCPSGDPLVTLVWFANLGRGLKAGQIVTCGSCTGLDRVPPGRVHVRFEGLGEAELTFAP